MRGGKKLIWLIVIIVIIVIGFICWQKFVPKKFAKNADGTQQAMSKIDQEQLAADYENSLRALMPEYKQTLENLTAETISDMRQKLLDLTLPAEFRDLHAQLVLLLDQAENADKTNMVNIDKRLTEIIARHEWLKLKIEN